MAKTAKQANNGKETSKKTTAKQATNTHTRVDENVRNAYDALMCVSAWVLQTRDADATKAAAVNVAELRQTLADADTRARVRAYAQACGCNWARVWGAWKAAATMSAKTSDANKGVALAHANALCVDADEARKRLCAYINYNYKKGVWDAPVPPSKVKQAAAHVSIIYNNKGLALDAMLRAAIKAAKEL